jgi:hypothetical protein
VQSEIDFLESHSSADVIVVNAITNEVVRAEYLVLNGVLRDYLAIYEYPEY